jgi:hypothetical protein
LVWTMAIFIHSDTANCKMVHLIESKILGMKNRTHSAMITKSEIVGVRYEHFSCRDRLLSDKGVSC